MPNRVGFNSTKSACAGDHQSGSERVNIPTTWRYPAEELSQGLKTICRRQQRDGLRLISLGFEQGQSARLAQPAHS